MSVTIKNNVIEINGSCYVRHDYYMHKVPTLLTTLHRISKQMDQPIVKIFFNDGEPIGSVNFRYVLDEIVRKLKLGPEQLMIFTHDISFCYPGAVIEHLRLPFFKIVLDNIGPWTDVKLDQGAVLYGGIYGRFNMGRFLLASYMEMCFPKDSFVIFHPPGDFVNFELDGNQEHFSKELAWFVNRTNTFGTLPPDHSGSVSYNGWVTLEHYQTIWPKYQIEIIAETDIYSPYFVTEKTFRCLLTAKPFLLYGGAGSLEYLRTLGFKTFNGIIDESYDLEPDADIRLELLQKEMSRIARLSMEERENLMHQLQPILAYNRDNYRKNARNYMEKTHDISH